MTAETITIQEIEAAINFYLKRSPAVGAILSREARILADLYGLMIYKRETTLDLRSITPEQKALLDQAEVSAPPELKNLD